MPHNPTLEAVLKHQIRLTADEVGLSGLPHRTCIPVWEYVVGTREGAFCPPPISVGRLVAEVSDLFGNPEDLAGAVSAAPDQMTEDGDLAGLRAELLGIINRNNPTAAPA